MSIDSNINVNSVDFNDILTLGVFYQLLNGEYNVNANSSNDTNFKVLSIPGNVAAQELEQLAKTYLQQTQVHRHLGKPRFIDKNPNNFAHAGLIQLLLPRAKIIDARRHPLDTTSSCYRQLFAGGQAFSYHLRDLGEYYLCYHDLMRHWEERDPGKIYRVQYETLVSDLEQQARLLLEFCGLPWEANVLEFYRTDRAIQTPSSEQVRQTVNTRSVDYWRNYEPYLGELVELLQPVLED